MERLNVESDLSPFTPIKNSLIDSENILNEHEKLLFIVLLRYGNHGNKIFPSLATISNKCGFSKRTAQRTVDSLIEKGLLEKRKRKSKKNGNTSNEYKLVDNDRIWLSSVDDLKQAIENEELEKAIRLVKSAGMEVVDKRKEPTSYADQSKDVSSNQNLLDSHNDTTNQPKSQQEMTEPTKRAELWESALDEFRFSKEELESIGSRLDLVPHSEMLSNPAARGSLELDRYHFMEMRAKDLKLEDSKKRIRNKCKYFIKMLEKYIPPAEEG